MNSKGQMYSSSLCSFWCMNHIITCNLRQYFGCWYRGLLRRRTTSSIIFDRVRELGVCRLWWQHDFRAQSPIYERSNITNTIFVSLDKLKTNVLNLTCFKYYHSLINLSTPLSTIYSCIYNYYSINVAHISCWWRKSAGTENDTANNC